MMEVGYSAATWRSNYPAIEGSALLKRENAMVLADGKVSVLCTCLFFVCDNWPEVVDAKDIV